MRNMINDTHMEELVFTEFSRKIHSFHMFTQSINSTIVQMSEKRDS